MDRKKKNFTEFEKNWLTSVLVRYKNVIENKKTDGSTVKAKNEAWESIASDFNSSQIINQKATSKQLQRLWTNMKQRQREALAKERQHRLSTGGGTSIGDAIIDPGVAMVAPNLLVEVPGVVDSDSGSVVFDENSIDICNVEENTADSIASSIEGDRKEIIFFGDLIAGPPAKVMRMAVYEPSLTVENSTTPESPIASTSSGGTVLLAPPSQPPQRRPLSACTSRSGTPRSRSTSPATSANRKDILMQQEASLRMRREEQLIVMDKALYEQRIISEKENTRKLKAEADLAELKLKIMTRQAENELH